ncbi:MAG: hypothetical protein P8J20_12775 [Novosphingobium sp.]|nr:hypothetical protein [Novosphingobium sp.]
MQFDPDAHKDMVAALRSQGARGPWLRLLSAVLELAGGKAEFLRHKERAWSSVTFSGSRHTIGLRFTGQKAIESGEAFIVALPEHEFTIPSQLVADATINAVDHEIGDTPVLTLEAELLLLDEC